MRAPPLLDLLGGQWSLGAAVTGIAWDGAVAGVGLADGSVALAPAAWEGAPKLVPRDPGPGLEVRPAEREPPPVTRIRAHPGAGIAFAVAPGGGFLTADASGAAASIDASGTVTPLAPAGPATHVAFGAAGWIARAAGQGVTLTGPGTAELTAPAPVTALAFDPAGRTLAIVHAQGVTLWSPDAPLRHLAAAAPPGPCAWSHTSAVLLCGLPDGRLHGWDIAGDPAGWPLPGDAAPASALAFLAGDALAASAGGPRILCWPPGPGAGPPEPCGAGSSAATRLVACHPTRALIAAGYDNGAVAVCPPGSTEMMRVRNAGDGAVTALAWSADGAWLAAGTASGDLGVLALPAALFRPTPSEANR